MLLYPEDKAIMAYEKQPQLAIILTVALWCACVPINNMSVC